MVKDLAEVTAPKDMPQLPQDLDTTNVIITEAINLLRQKLDVGTETINAAEVRESCNFGEFQRQLELVFLSVYCHI